MKIKHWQGYGSVEAKKLSNISTKDFLGNKISVLKVRVSGNHEWGLERNDTYDVVNWIGKRFAKDLTDARQVEDMQTYDYYDANNVEHCEYTITYRKEC